MIRFETNVQDIKYRVLAEVARLAREDKLEDAKEILTLPEKIIPGPEPTMRCCIYKERAIVGQRIEMALGGHEEVPGQVEVLSIACDECPVSRVTVSDACRGCIAHRCANACPKGAISFPDRHAHIDHSKCIACGRCVAVCPYNAITKNVRPCERACKANAISIGENKKAHINDEKCVSCGACVYQCPFGAVMDKSYLTQVVKLLKEAQSGGLPVYAVVAPSISGQFEGITTGQIAAGLKAMGFKDVVEAAFGADLVAYFEAQELKEKGFLTSSCCPAFVAYIKKNFPTMVDKISHNVSPMIMAGKVIRRSEPQGCRVVFIGPCVAKKSEADREDVKGVIDAVMTFEELYALFTAYDINLAEMEDLHLNNASYYGRIFARSGGLSDAVAEAFREQQVPEEEFKANPLVCSGLEECKIALLKANKGLLPENFIEGMACEQGCIGGPGCLNHGPKEKIEVDKYGKLAMNVRLDQALMIYNMVGMDKE